MLVGILNLPCFVIVTLIYINNPMIYNAPKVFVLFLCCDVASCRHCVVLVCFGVHSPGPAKP